MSLLDPTRGLPAYRTSEGDRYYDYCLEPYRPRRPPRGKLRSENLLWASLELAGVREEMTPVLEAIQHSLGKDHCVYGVKYDGTRFWWELYFYDPQKEDPAATVDGLAATLAPWLRFAPSCRPSIPYMMVSFDVDEEVLRQGEVPELNLYLTGTDEHAGRSYIVRSDAMELANTYRFLHPKVDIDTVLSLIQSSAFIDYENPRTLPAVLIPELFACKRICVAKKRVRDGVYYSGIDIDQLRFFLKRMAYPDRLQRIVEKWAPQLDHLYFDVGLDIEQDASGSIRYPKTSFYGTV